jgi:hypothetical protein
MTRENNLSGHNNWRCDMDIKQRMKAEGFSLIDTGGGCIAYHKTVYVLITDIGGGGVPETINDEVLVGLYDVATDETVCVQMYASIVDFLKK